MYTIIDKNNEEIGSVCACKILSSQNIHWKCAQINMLNRQADSQCDKNFVPSLNNA